MEITKNKVASIHYTLKNTNGEIIDSSAGHEPLTYLHGAGNLIPGMEEGLEGKVTGNKFELAIEPEKGYGTRQEQLIQKLPRTNFPSQGIKVGMQFQTNKGAVVTVTHIGLESITVDGNHPLAGEHLHFSVQVMDVRSATEEEISHGHVHGPGGHHH
jgi:FKBP-type peptidyl-prolyl cis-trans isomerase SlyD